MEGRHNMKRRFRFDYNYKMFGPFILLFIISIIFFLYCINNLNIIGIYISILFAVFCIINFIYGLGYGLKINYKMEYIKLRTAIYKEKIYFNEVQHINYYEKKTDKGRKLKNIFRYIFRNHNFIYAKYSFNNGKVFVICIHFRNGWVKEIEYPWMYKEKSQRKLTMVENKLKKILNEFNKYIID